MQLFADDWIKTAEKLSKSNPDSAISFITKKLTTEKDPEIINKARIALASSYFRENNIKESISNFQKALAYYQEKNREKEIGRIYYYLSSTYYAIGAYNKALDYAFSATDIFIKTNNYKRLAVAYNTIGIIYKELKNYKFSLDFYNKAEKITETKTKDTVVLGTLKNNIGEVLFLQNKIDTAIILFNESIELKKKILDNFSIAYPYGNLGDIAYKQGDYKKALSYYKKVYFLSERHNNPFIKTLAAQQIANVYLKLNLPELAHDYFKLALKFNKKLNNIQVKADIYKDISAYFEQINKPDSANYYLKKYITIKDSVLNDDLNKKLSQLQIAYNIEEQQKENELLKKQNQEKNIKLKEKNKEMYLYLSIALLSILLVIIVVIRYKYRKKYAILSDEKAKEIDSINKQLQELNSQLEKKINEKTKALNTEIDERKQVERELQNLLYREKQINKQKSKFINKISNEIRTPLNAISGLAALLQKKFADTNDSTIKDYIKGIVDNSERLLNLLNNIIDFNKIQTNDITLKFEKINISEIIAKVIQLHQFNINDKKIDLKINVDDNIEVVSDKIYLSKVLNEIIDNAIKFTEHGSISIESIEQSDTVILKITDTGIGIEQSRLSGIFTHFDQINKDAYDYNSEGIGLPIVKKIINLLNGRIEISSKPGKGTRVFLYLPKNLHLISNSNSKEENEYKNLLSDHIVKQKAYQIFLVEDDYFNKLMLETTLDRIGMVTSAASGKEALKLIEEKHNSGEEFDIMIIDINLPDGWDGISLMKTIKEKWPLYNDIIFIAQTAYSDEEDKKKILDAGFNEYITKPIEHEQLINIVKMRLMS